MESKIYEQSGTLSMESREFLYHQLANILRNQIVRGVLKPGEQIPTYQDLIDRHKVSLSTVKLAISELVNEGLLYSRQGKGTFVSSKKFSVTKTGLIGLLVTDIRNPFYSSLAHIIQHHARDYNYGVIHSYTNDKANDELEAIELLIKKGVDGIIAVPLTVPGSIKGYQELMESHIPVVFIDRYVPEVQNDYVIVDSEAGVEQALHYLFSLGHSKIACITAEPINQFVVRRMDAFRKVMKEQGIEVNDNWIVSGGLPDDDGGYAAAKRLFSQAERPTAIFTTNDITAIGVLRAANEEEMVVPDDISIVGFDNIPLSEHTHPPLTTIAQPINRMGATALDLLMQRISSDANSGIQEIVLEPKLIIRESCKAISSKGKPQKEFIWQKK
jgi:DNA-binding LacI/PurR family transcriptional regulator